MSRTILFDEAIDLASNAIAPRLASDFKQAIASRVKVYNEECKNREEDDTKVENHIFSEFNGDLQDEFAKTGKNFGYSTERVKGWYPFYYHTLFSEEIRLILSSAKTGEGLNKALMKRFSVVSQNDLFNAGPGQVSYSSQLPIILFYTRDKEELNLTYTLYDSTERVLYTITPSTGKRKTIPFENAVELSTEIQDDFKLKIVKRTNRE